ncbi:hypothetical protein Q4E93_29525 [Flavitalea sp. BT771]|uniref:hypothetical protein n=1 Tax=Flavitalea sp. BT771 TaxID=3063329 RepID=UPI0026E16A7F|nr:hypothetical protein [Flavitalea sp. BT771]MDO6434789.1 hypothetical protein [Flavitalea sp. BT771]MDV6223689.1 hypothetical protein [Flavitalea sp. BT771]
MLINDDPKEKMKLILVGNKPPRRAGLSEQIDSFDFVMRVNRMNYLERSGYRINGLFLEANTTFKDQYAGGANKSKIRTAGKILMREQWYSRFQTWSQYLTPIQYSEIELIDESFAIRETGFKRLTSSILLLGHLLNSEWSKKYRIYITCLDIEKRAEIMNKDPTWAWHLGAGPVEQEYLLKHLRLHNLIRIDDE